MDEEKLFSLLKNINRQGWVNKEDAEKAEKLGLVDIRGPNSMALTEQGQARLDRFPPQLNRVGIPKAEVF